jgi:hypothetical protein
MSRFCPSERAMVWTTPRSIPTAGVSRRATATTGSWMRKQICQPSGSLTSLAPVMRPRQASAVSGRGRVHRNLTRPTNRTVTSPQRRFTRTTRRSAACGRSIAIRAVRCLNLGGPDSLLLCRSQARRYCRRTAGWPALAIAPATPSRAEGGSGRREAADPSLGATGAWRYCRLAHPNHATRGGGSRAHAPCAPADPTSATGPERDRAEPCGPGIEPACRPSLPSNVPRSRRRFLKRNRTHVRHNRAVHKGCGDSNQRSPLGC